MIAGTWIRRNGRKWDKKWYLRSLLTAGQPGNLGRDVTTGQGGAEDVSMPVMHDNIVCRTTLSASFSFGKGLADRDCQGERGQGPSHKSFRYGCLIRLPSCTHRGEGRLDRARKNPVPIREVDKRFLAFHVFGFSINGLHWTCLAELHFRLGLVP